MAIGEEITRTRMHRALHRENLLAGCERELLLLTGMVVGLLVVVAMNWVAAGVGVAVWVVCIGVLRTMGKADPVMSRVYLRHIRYRDYYPARSRFGAPSAVHKR